MTDDLQIRVDDHGEVWFSVIGADKEFQLSPIGIMRRGLTDRVREAISARVEELGREAHYVQSTEAAREPQEGPREATDDEAKPMPRISSERTTESPRPIEIVEGRVDGWRWQVVDTPDGRMWAIDNRPQIEELKAQGDTKPVEFRSIVLPDSVIEAFRYIS